MYLSDQQKRICEQVINVFETGKVEGDYGAISIYADGPQRTGSDGTSYQIRQITYGRSQTTESGNLRELLQMYVDKNGTYSNQISSYLPKLKVLASQTAREYVLVKDQQFQNLLQDAGRKDPIMQQVQDQFFDQRYFQPALDWADKHGFKLPLSALVIYDSFIHSGGILDFLRRRFPEVPPVKGGDEKTWITQYVDARQDWLAHAENQILHLTVYRTECFKEQIDKGNW